MHLEQELRRSVNRTGAMITGHLPSPAHPQLFPLQRSVPLFDRTHRHVHLSALYEQRLRATTMPRTQNANVDLLTPNSFPYNIQHSHEHMIRARDALHHQVYMSAKAGVSARAMLPHGSIPLPQPRHHSASIPQSIRPSQSLTMQADHCAVAPARIQQLVRQHQQALMVQIAVEHQQETRRSRESQQSRRNVANISHHPGRCRRSGFRVLRQGRSPIRPTLALREPTKVVTRKRCLPSPLSALLRLLP
jgi:hypothetical protein